MLIKNLKLDDDEKVIAVIRQTVIVHIPTIILAAILILAPFFFLFPLFSFGKWGEIVFYFVLFIGIVYSLRKFFQWYFNACIITNKKVIDVARRGFFQKTVSEIPYEKIEDAFYKVKGILQTVFRYGQIVLAPRNTKTTIVLKNIKKPADIQNLILNFCRQRSYETDVRNAQDGISVIIERAKSLSPTERKALIYALKELDEEADKL